MEDSSYKKYKKYKQKYKQLHSKTGGFTIFSDYDDTIVCSNRSKGGISGFDKQLLAHTIYPGQVTLYKLLMEKAPLFSSGGTDIDTLYILTARPHRAISPNITEIVSRLNEPTHDPSIEPEIIYGDLGIGARWATSRGEYRDPSLDTIKQDMGRSKFLKWKEYQITLGRDEAETRQPDSEASTHHIPSIFFGDDAQGDFYTAKDIIDDLDTNKILTHRFSVGDQTYPIFRAYIHQVLYHHAPDDLDPKYKDHICFYTNSIEAAKDAKEKNLLTEQEVKDVYDSFIKDTLVICQRRQLNPNRKITWKALYDDRKYSVEAKKISWIDNYYIRISMSLPKATRSRHGKKTAGETKYEEKTYIIINPSSLDEKTLEEIRKFLLDGKIPRTSFSRSPSDKFQRFARQYNKNGETGMASERFGINKW